MERYTVLKSTGTHADVIAAIGAAEVLCELEPRLTNCGDRFEVSLPRAAAPSDMAATDPGFLFSPKSGKLPPAIPSEWIFEAAHANSEAGAAAGKPIDPAQRMYSILDRLNAAAGPNKVVLEFIRMPREIWLRKVWAGLEGRKDFVTRPLLVQLFNPHAARGYSLLKPSGVDRNDKSKNYWSEPFLEWLRYRGFFAGCAGWFLDRDIRVYCPVPGNLPYSLFRGVAAAFRELRLSGSPAKVDCRAVLGLTLILLDQMERPVSPRTLIESVSVAHYRNMGQSNTVMAMERLAIPGWVDIQTHADINRWRGTLIEHDRILKRLSDSKSEEAALLSQYRRVLQMQSEPALEEFLKFLADYGLLAFRRQQSLSPAAFPAPLPMLAIRSVQAILGSQMTYRQIMQDRGFQAISRALRASTFNAVAARNNGVSDHRRVRHGVLAEIRRSYYSGKPELFRTVSAFVTDFNVETAKRYQNQWRDTRISEDDVAAFATLLDSAASAELVGSMLCALASCRPDQAVADTAHIEVEQAIPA